MKRVRSWKNEEQRKEEEEEEEEEEEDSIIEGPAYGLLLESLGVSRTGGGSSSSSSAADEEDQDVDDENDDDEEDDNDKGALLEDECEEAQASFDGGAVADPHEGELYGDGEGLREADPYVQRFCQEWSEDQLASWRNVEAHYETVARLPHAEFLVSAETPSLVASLRSQGKEEVHLVRDGFVKQKLAARWSQTLTPLQRAVFPALMQYCDLTLPVLAGTDERAQMRDLMALHAINHILKAREREWENSALLRTKVIDEAHDQGFTPVRVILVLPMRCDAYDMVRRIIALSPFGEMAVENRRKFEVEMAADEVPTHKGKPVDFKERFYGNSDDSFRFGVRFTRSTIRLFSGFYHSDMIVCSPLGLRTIIGDDGDMGRDYDFLSSVELVIFDSCEMLQMQNWDHVELLLASMNKVPTKIGETDFSRLQSHFVSGSSSLLRQTVLMTQVHTPDLNALTRRFCSNPRRGHLIVKHAGVLHQVGAINQVFQRVPCSSVRSAADERFEFFTKNLLPGVLKAQRTGVLIYIPNYFDYLRVRQHLKSLGVDFCHICEYTKKADVARDRADFVKRNASIMLYTERVHFYHRIKIRGTENVIFYALPTFPQFYMEVIGFVQSTLVSTASVTALYAASMDRLALERLVGTERADTILQSTKTAHLFST